jgi:hypothetical protein
MPQPSTVVSSLSTRLALAAIGAALLAAPAAADTGAMTDKEIRAAVVGKRIYLQTPFGGEFPLNYRTNGKVDGDGQALGLGRFMAPADKGKWWIKGGRLCQQWTEWYDGKAQCFVLQRTGETTLYWKRDDGLEGEARIGR